MSESAAPVINPPQLRHFFDNAANIESAQELPCVLLSSAIPPTAARLPACEIVFMSTIDNRLTRTLDGKGNAIVTFDGLNWYEAWSRPLLTTPRMYLFGNVANRILRCLLLIASVYVELWLARGAPKARGWLVTMTLALCGFTWWRLRLPSTIISKLLAYFLNTGGKSFNLILLLCRSDLELLSLACES